MDGLEVAVLHERPVGDVLRHLEQVLGQPALEHRAEERGVAERRDPPLRGLAGRPLRPEDVQVQRHGELGVVGHDLAERRQREPVREVEVVHGLQAREPVGAAGRVHAGGVAEVGGAPRLVERRPGGDAVAERLPDHAGVVGERLRGAADRPAALVLERLREVPVVQRRDRRDVPREQPVDEPGVEVEPRLVHGAAALGDDARPGHGEAVRLQAEVGHEVEIGVEAVVVVVRHVARVAVHRPAGRVAVRVPDARAAAVLVDRPLDLVRRGGRSEHERLREPHPITPCASSRTQRDRVFRSARAVLPLHGASLGIPHPVGRLDRYHEACS